MPLSSGDKSPDLASTDPLAVELNMRPMTAGNHNGLVDVESDGAINAMKMMGEKNMMQGANHRRAQSIHNPHQRVASHHNLRQQMRRGGGRSGGAVRIGSFTGAQQVSSTGNYTPILRQQRSAAVHGRFKRRLGTEPLVFSEARMNTATAGGLHGLVESTQDDSSAPGGGTNLGSEAGAHEFAR